MKPGQLVKWLQEQLEGDNDKLPKLVDKLLEQFTPFEALEWLERDNPVLGGTPLELLKAGLTEDVLDALAKEE